MKSFLSTAALICIISRLSSGASSHPKNSLLGHTQVETVELWNKIIEGTFDSYTTSHSYNPNFRPPVFEGAQGSDPTLVDFSLRDIHVTKYNETEGKLYVDAELISEFTDSRLAFDPPYNGFTFTQVTRDTNIWTPKMRAEDADDLHRRLDSFGQDEDILVNPDGRVYHKLPIQFTLKDKQDQRQRIFSFKLVGKKLTVEDVFFRWNQETPLTLKEQTVQTEVAYYSIIPAVDKCRQSEDWGSFVGLREFACIQLTLKLVSSRRY